MKSAYIVTGTLKGDRTLVLDEPIGLYDYKVRVIVEPVEALPRRPLKEVMEEIWREQDERGYVRMTKEEIDEHLRDLRGCESE
ncbi:MAG: hypothetical protein F4Y44_04685 [Chloroflexi bacterium]|nr:hypothetical protein [Chloroflexota bacterium]